MRGCVRVWEGVGRCGKVWDGMGDREGVEGCGRAWEGVGRCGRVWRDVGWVSGASMYSCTHISDTPLRNALCFRIDGLWFMV